MSRRDENLLEVAAGDQLDALADAMNVNPPRRWMETDAEFRARILARARAPWTRRAEILDVVIPAAAPAAVSMAYAVGHLRVTLSWPWWMRGPWLLWARRRISRRVLEVVYNQLPAGYSADVAS